MSGIAKQRLKAGFMSIPQRREEPQEVTSEGAFKVYPRLDPTAESVSGMGLGVDTLKLP